MNEGSWKLNTSGKESFETESAVSPAISEPMLEKIPFCRNKKLNAETFDTIVSVSKCRYFGLKVSYRYRISIEISVGKVSISVSVSKF